MQRHAPENIFTDLKDKVLAGEVTVSQSREIEQIYRPERPQSERTPVAPEITTPIAIVTTEEVVESHVHENLEKPIVKSTPTSFTADKIANVLATTLADWSKSCVGMRYPPKFSQAHTEVRVSYQRKRLRLDLVGVVRWSYKKPKDIFGVEIKSSLSDFESDRYRLCSDLFRQYSQLVYTLLLLHLIQMRNAIVTTVTLPCTWLWSRHS